MNADLRDWLAAYPGIRRISVLALDAHACGLLDLEVAVNKAVLRDASVATGQRRTEHHSLGYHQRAALGYSKRRNRPAIRLEGGVAVLHGSITAGMAISQTRHAAVLHFAASLPETAVALLPGRALADVVDCPLVRRRNYTITTAEQTDDGLYVSFPVLTMSMPPRAANRAMGLVDI
ncbi:MULTISPECIES: hypothetical protein [Sphingomonas]|uniref:hypothetical protein n=1 Tax=Sphingomonas TaxID=13687 RepID=UPI002FE07FE4